MWTAFPSTHEDEQHIDNVTFEGFWSGELRDDAISAAVSYHCVACSDCRKRREAARVRYQTRLERARQVTFRTLILATAAAVWRKRKPIGTVAISLGILIAGIFWFGGTTDQNNLTTSTHQTPVPTPTPNGGSTPGSSESAHVSKEDSQPAPSPVGPRKDLLAQAQINLRRVPDGAGDRSGSREDTEPYFTVVASRSRPTRMRITLPLNSKKGRYYVSIREPAFLREVAVAKGVSSDGITLALAVKLGHLNKGQYVLRIERQASGSGNKEYVGDYNIVVVTSSRKKRSAKANR